MGGCSNGCAATILTDGLVLAGAADRVVNDVLGVNSASYDITNKLPGTIECE